MNRPGRLPSYLVGDRRVRSWRTEAMHYLHIDKEAWLDKQSASVPPGVVFGGAKNDPTFNRLTIDIHTAVKQFDAVNPDVASPNVLTFVNHEPQCGFLDLSWW